jgi:hypothetical protein
MHHAIRHHSLIKLQTSFIIKSLIKIQKITTLVLQNLPDANNVELKHDNSKLSFYDPSDLLANNLEDKPAHLLFYTDTVQYANINYTVPTNTDSHFSKGLPSKIDNEKLSLHFAFRPYEVIQHTLTQTIQLDKSTIHHHMQRDLKSRFQMLRQKRINEVIATDTYFANDKSI